MVVLRNNYVYMTTFYSNARKKTIRLKLIFLILLWLLYIGLCPTVRKQSLEADPTRARASAS